MLLQSVFSCCGLQTVTMRLFSIHFDSETVSKCKLVTVPRLEYQSLCLPGTGYVSSCYFDPTPINYSSELSNFLFIIYISVDPDHS